MKDIQQYIESGIVQAYVLGLTTESERNLFEDLIKIYPDLQEVRRQFEQSLEEHSFQLCDSPPKEVVDKFLEAISGKPSVGPSTIKLLTKPVSRRIKVWEKVTGWLKHFFSHSPNAKPPVSPRLSGINEPPKPPAPPPPDDADLPDPPNHNRELRNETLLRKVLKAPKEMDYLNHRQFEELVADLVTVLGFTAKLTKETKDGGKDIIIFHRTDIGDFTFYMECKHRSTQRKVEVDVIRELLGTVTSDRVTGGIVVTNAYFSPEAIRFQSTIVNNIKLISRDKILRWIDYINGGARLDQLF